MEKVTLTTQNLLDNMEILKQIANSDMSAKTGIKLGKAIFVINNLLETIQTNLQQLQKRFIQKDEQGNPILSEDKKSVLLENPALYMQELQEVMNMTHDLEIDKLDEEELETIKDFKPLYMSVLLSLQFIK